MIVQRSLAREKPDEIDEIAGDRRYMAPYYPAGLSEACVGPYERTTVGVSRFYRWRTPQLVVDYEPAPVQGRFYVEAKRRFFMERGIVFVPVFLKERLTKAEFEKRLADETAALQEFKAGGRRKLSPADVAKVLAMPETRTLVQMEVRRRWTAGGYKAAGAARMQVLARLTREVEASFREQIADGRMGLDSRNCDTQVAVG